MFRLIRFLAVLGFGIYLGVQANQMLMRAECGQTEGTWSAGLCLISEVPS